MPAERPSLLAFLAACKPSEVDFPDIDNLPPLDDVTDNTLTDTHHLRGLPPYSGDCEVDCARITQPQHS